MPILDNILCVKLDKKVKKFICDLLIEDFREGVVRPHKIKELRETFLSEFTDNVVSRYLDLFGNNLEDKNSFSNEYDNLESLFSTQGCKGILESTHTLRRMCLTYFKNEKKLFGDMLSSAVDIQVEYIAGVFSLDNWDSSENSSFFGLLRTQLEWVDRGEVTRDRLLGASISNVVSTTDRDGMNATIANEVVSIESASYYNDLLSPELYVNLISSIKKGTKLLFPLANSAKIHGDIYSILNYYYEMEYKSYCVLMSQHGAKLNFDYKIVTPHKLKCVSPFNEGHLVTVDPSYARSGIGQVDNCNKIVESGKLALKIYIDAVEHAKSKVSKDNSVSTCFLVMHVMDYLTEHNLESISGNVDFVNVVTVVDSIICAEQLISILNSNDLSILSFPIIEVRENTWSRFSCLYELLNFYRTHVKLEELNKYGLDNRPYFNNSLSPVSIMDIVSRQRTAELSSYETYLENNFSRSKIKNRLPITDEKKDSLRLSFNQSDSLISNVYSLIETMYASGKSWGESLKSIYSNSNVMFGIDLFECIYVPLLARANDNFANCDFNQASLLCYMSMGNGNVLCNLIDAQLQGLNKLLTCPEYYTYSDVIAGYGNMLTAIKTTKNYKEYYELLNKIDKFIYNLIEQVSECKCYFDDGYRLSRGIYMFYSNLKFAEYLYQELSTSICCILNDPNINVLVSDAREDLTNCLNNCGNMVTRVLINITNYKNCRLFYEQNTVYVFNDYVRWLGNVTENRLTSQARFKDFMNFNIMDCNSLIMDNMFFMVTNFIQYLEGKMMSKLTQNVKRGLEENYWESVKDLISRKFAEKHMNYLAEGIYSLQLGDDSYGNELLVDCVPTLRNSTIIGYSQPFKTYLRDGGEYYVYSTLGYKMLLRSRLGIVEIMEPEDVELILNTSEWR